MSNTIIYNFLSNLYDTGINIENDYAFIENVDKIKQTLSKYGKTIVKNSVNPYMLDTDLIHNFMEKLEINYTVSNINNDIKNYKNLLEMYNNNIEKIMNKLLVIDTDFFSILFLLNLHTTNKSPITNVYYGKVRDTDVVTNTDIMKAKNILHDMLQNILDLITPKNIDDVVNVEKDESVFYGYLLSLCETSLEIVTDNIQLFDTVYNCVYGINAISSLLKDLLTSRTFDMVVEMVDENFEDLYQYITDFLWYNNNHNLQKYVNKYGNTIRDTYIDLTERNRSVKQLFNFRRKN